MNDFNPLPLATPATLFPTGELDLNDAPTSDPVPDPLASINWTGDGETDSLSEAKAIHTAFLQRAKDEQRRVLLAGDSEYWCCLCFQTREQKEAFLRAMDWLQFGDKYLDGGVIAKRQAITLPHGNPPFVKAKPDRTLSEISLPLED